MLLDFQLPLHDVTVTLDLEQSHRESPTHHLLSLLTWPVGVAALLQFMTHTRQVTLSLCSLYRPGRLLPADTASQYSHTGTPTSSSRSPPLFLPVDPESLCRHLSACNPDTK